MKEEMNLSDLWGGCIWSSNKPMTNYDRIISKTPEELAEWMAINTSCFFCKVKNKNICSLDGGTCTEEWLSWLKSPVEEKE